MPIPLGMMLALGATATSALTNKSNQEQQVAQQGKLTAQQVAAQMKLGRFNQQLAMKTWDETNYAAQVEQMKKAGLNVGLMYNGQGGGGTTSGGQAGNVAGGQASPNAASMGIQTGLSAAMTAAQIKNLEANTEKTKVDTAKTAGVDTTKVGAETENIIQQTQNAKVNNEIAQYQKRMAELEVKATEQTIEFTIQEIKSNAEKVINETRSAAAKAEIDEKTKEQIINQVNTASTEQMLRIATQKKNIQLTNEQIKKIINDVKMDKQGNMRDWDKLSLESRTQAIKQIADEAGGGEGLMNILKLIF